MPGCCTVNRLLEMIHGRGYERAGAWPEEGAGNGVGRAGGGVRQRGLAGMSRDPQGPMGTGCQLPAPLSEHPGNTDRGVGRQAIANLSAATAAPTAPCLAIYQTNGSSS